MVLNSPVFTNISILQTGFGLAVDKNNVVEGAAVVVRPIGPNGGELSQKWVFVPVSKSDANTTGHICLALSLDYCIGVPLAMENGPITSPRDKETHLILVNRKTHLSKAHTWTLVQGAGNAPGATQTGYKNTKVFICNQMDPNFVIDVYHEATAHDTPAILWPKKKVNDKTVHNQLWDATAFCDPDVFNILFGVDVMFVIDGTGSMAPWIDAAKAKAASILDAINHVDANAKPRAGVVIYRDRSVGLTLFEEIPWANGENIQAFNAKLALVKTQANPDIPEAVDVGLRHALDAKWVATCRILVHIGDAPPQGAGGKFWMTQRGTLPQGPYEDCEVLVRQLAKNQVDYYFIRISPETDKMSALFKQYYEQENTGAHFNQLELSSNPEEFKKFLDESVKNSMKKSGLFSL